MSQGTLVIPNTGVLSGLQLVNAINAAVDRLVTQTSGSTDPSTLSGGVKPYSFWLDTSVSPNVLRMRNAANTAWAAMGTISSSNFVPDLANADIATALGYTPVNKAGDTMSGDLTAPNVFGSAKVQAPELKATTKIVFPDNSEQVTAATTAFPSGTVMLFVQSAAPTGWTKSTAHNDKALRVVSGSVSSGGSATFSSVFANSKSTDGTTLSASQMPPHNHQANGVSGPYSAGSQQPTVYGHQPGSYLSPSNPFYRGFASGYDTETGSYLYYVNNSNTYAMISNGGGQAHSHTIGAMNLQYVDVILATKN